MARLKLSLIVVALITFAAAVAVAATDGVVKSDDTVVFSGKSTQAKELTRLKAGAEIQVLVTQGDWMRVKTADGKVGWVQTTSVTTNEGESSGDLDDLDMSGVEVASVERNQTGGAIRGRPGRHPGELRIVVLVAGYGHAEAEMLERQLHAKKMEHVVAKVIKSEAPGAGPSGPVGGGPAGRALARALGANAVVAISPSKAGENGSDHIRYEIIDGRTAKVVAQGNQPAPDLSRAVSQIAALAAKKLAPAPKE